MHKYHIISSLKCNKHVSRMLRKCNKTAIWLWITMTTGMPRDKYKNKLVYLMP